MHTTINQRGRKVSRRRGLGHTTVFRLALIYAGLYALITVFVLGGVYEFAALHINAQIDGDIKGEVKALTALRQDQGPTALQEAVARRANLLTPSPESGIRYYLLLNAAGGRIAGNLPEWPPYADETDGWVTYTIGADVAARAGLEKPADFGADDDLRVRGFSTVLNDGDQLLVVETLDEADELTSYILLSLAAAVGLLLIFGIAGGVWMGRHVLARLESVRHAATDIMAGDLSRRIPPSPRHDEFGELAETLNAMLARIEELMTGLRQVTDNVAHDLRSPLNRLRSRLEVTLRKQRDPGEYRSSMENAVADADDLLQTFNAMLSLAELEAGVSRETWGTVSFGALCEDVASVYAPLAEDKRIDFRCTMTPLKLRGNGRLLAQAVGNLLDNAIKYTPAGGSIQLTPRHVDSTMILTIADSGPGVPVADRQRVFKRFTRLDESRTQAGNGLGLSLVRAVIRLHHGEIRLGDNRPGLRVEVRLPTAT